MTTSVTTGSDVEEDDMVGDGGLVLPTDEILPTPSASSSSSKKGQKRKAKNESSECDKSLQCLQEYVKSKMSETKRVAEDEDDMFGKVVASDLKKVKSGKRKRSLKKKLTDLIFETLEEEEEEKIAQSGGHSQQFVLADGKIINVVYEYDLSHKEQ